MALSMASGSFNCPAATGNDSQTGVGFQGVAGFFFLTGLTADGNGVDFQLGFGAAAAATARAAISAADDDAVATTVSRRQTTNTRCIHLRDPANANVVEADFVSFDPDGFTLNFTAVTSGVDIHYIIWGGADITNANVLTFNAATVTGNQAVTGMGFQGDFFLFFSNVRDADADSSVDALLCLGTAISSTKRWAINASSADARATTSSCHRQQLSDHCIILPFNTGSINGSADFVSADADGFTINWTNAPVVASRVHVLALRGGSYQVGVFDQNTTAGNQAVTGTGFTPSGTIFASVNGVQNAAVQTHARLSLGVGVSSTSRRCAWSGSKHAEATSQCDQSSDQTRCIKTLTEGTPSLETEADYVSNDADGFTVNNITVDATSREIVYAAFGDAGAAGGGKGLLFMQP